MFERYVSRDPGLVIENPIGPCGLERRRVLENDARQLHRRYGGRLDELIEDPDQRIMGARFVTTREMLNEARRCGVDFLPVAANVREHDYDVNRIIVDSNGVGIDDVLPLVRHEVGHARSWELFGDGGSEDEAEIWREVWERAAQH